MNREEYIRQAAAKHYKGVANNEMLELAFRMGAQWADKQLADYLQREWDRCAGACSSIVSAHCREVERMANDLGIKLKFNNPYIE